MVRNIVVLGGNSHPKLLDSICNILGLPACDRILSRFECGESRCEIKDSVRGKDVYIIQTGFGGNGGRLNDHFMDLCIMISACKTGSARKVTAVLPLFPYSRQPDLAYNKAGAPLFTGVSESGRKDYTFDSVPATPAPGMPRTAGLTNGADITNRLLKTSLTNGNVPPSPAVNGKPNGEGYFPVNGSANGVTNGVNGHRANAGSISSQAGSYTTHDYENVSLVNEFQARPGYKQWVAQAGTLVANLLTCAGADHGMCFPQQRFLLVASSRGLEQVLPFGAIQIPLARLHIGSSWWQFVPYDLDADAKL
jgi:ribose-phosphate pyrophosphokinase